MALSGYDDPFASNPAGLAGSHGVWFEFARQPFFVNFNDDEMQYRSWSFGVESPVGVFMATYRRLDYGRAYMSDPADIIPNGKLHPNDFTVGLAWGYAIDPRFQVGVGVKMFNQNDLVGWWGSQLSDADLNVKSGPAIVCDLGVLSNTGSLFGKGKVQDNLSLGLALQGFGTPFRYHYTGESFYYDPATGATRIVAVPIEHTIPL
ncbi:MAG TPA: hypothetical protein VMH23_14420, partial [Bacteroidota bacterium]|nr:hypothetical protein [Bacteroidota bacterium]